VETEGEDWLCRQKERIGCADRRRGLAVQTEGEDWLYDSYWCRILHIGEDELFETGNSGR
jgi:hypothetical protein